MLYLLEGYETERLSFRLLKEDDFEDWLHLFDEPEAAIFLGLSQIQSPKEQCEKWFEKVFDRYENDLGGMNVLIYKETQQLVGQCGLLVQEIDDQNELEVGYSILPKFWNMGFATEAARCCKEAAFKNKYADSLISIVHVENVKSKKVALNNNMHYEKTTTYKEMPVDIFRVLKEQ